MDLYRTSTRLFILLAAILGLTTGCGGADDAGSPVAATDAPDWITHVYPAAGAETTATRALQVRHETLPADREVRLILDGTDVTAYAQQGPGLLEYDIDQENAPVELKPGRHSATVELYTVQPGASEGVDSFSASERAVVESYSWEFDVL